MKPFPGPIAKVGHSYVLNKEQEAWLRRRYPMIENVRLCKAMGISDYKLHGFARSLGLNKSEAGIRAIIKRRSKAAAATNEKNGCYDRKRGHPCSEATLEGNRKRWAEVRAGLRPDCCTVVKERDPEKYAAWMEKKRVERKESIRKEKMRILYGLERKTKLKPVVMTPYKQSQIHHRYCALRRGYLLDEDCSEGSPGRYVIYYDDETKRSEKFEQNCIKDGFTFKRDE